MKGSSVSGWRTRRASVLPEFEPGSRRRRRARLAALALVALAGVAAWQVVRSQRLPQSTPAAESEARRRPPSAAEPAPPQEPAPQPTVTAPTVETATATSAQPSARASTTTPPRKRRPPPPPPKKSRKEPGKVDDLTIEIPTPPEPAEAELTSPAESPPPAGSPQGDPAPHAE